MNFTLRALAATVVLAALATAALAAAPSLATDAGLDFWNAPNLWRAAGGSERERNELERRGEIVVRRMSLRAETVQEVLAGRVTPEAAVQAFVALNRSDPKALAWCRAHYAGASDEERAARQLVSHVRNLCPNAGAAADDAARRLGVPAGDR